MRRAWRPDSQPWNVCACLTVLDASGVVNVHEQSRFEGIVKWSLSSCLCESLGVHDGITACGQARRTERGRCCVGLGELHERFSNMRVRVLNQPKFS